MRYWSCVVILLLLAATLRAQDKAADPDAINFSGKLDTVVLAEWDSGPFAGVRVPDVNSDRYDDIFLDYAGGSNSTELRLGGPLIRQAPVASYQSGASFLVDLDGDGVQDFVAPFSIYACLHRGRTSFPYFESKPTSLFTDWDVDSHLTPLGAADLNGDGVSDAVMIFSSPAYFKLAAWPGGAYLDTTANIGLSDSLALNVYGYRYTAMGDVGKRGDHYAIIGFNSSGQGTIVSVNLKWPISHSIVAQLSNTTDDGADGIVPIEVYITDITGDGVPDLLVGDGSYIYIFKGGDDFGSYRLTKSHAYYRIPSPRILYPEQWLNLTGFGSYMYACGDLSGSGTPYLATEGVVGGAERAWRFIYAGGKALDSLYDGMIDIDMGGLDVLDTLHSYGEEPHTAVALRLENVKSLQHDDMVAVLYRDAEKLPHKPNPNMRVGSIGVAAGSISVVPSIADRSVHITTTYGDRVRRGLLQIHDLLGALFESRNVWVSRESETEFVDLSHVASGTYIATVLPEGGAPISTKFIVQHQGGHNRRLPYTANAPFLPW